MQTMQEQLSVHPSLGARIAGPPLHGLGTVYPKLALSGLITLYNYELVGAEQ